MIEDLMYQLSDGQAVIFSIAAALTFLLVVVALALLLGSIGAWLFSRRSHLSESP